MKKFASGTFIAAAAMLVVATGAVAQSTPSTPSTQSQPAQSTQPTDTSGAGSSAMPGGAQQGVLIDSGSLVGSSVRDAQGKDLGKVSSLMIDPQDGTVQTVVVTMGGTFGIGGNSVAMPWDQVKITKDQDRLIVTVDQQMLQQAPKAQRGRDGDSPSASPRPQQK